MTPCFRTRSGVVRRKSRARTTRRLPRDDGFQDAPVGVDPSFEATGHLRCRSHRPRVKPLFADPRVVAMSRSMRPAASVHSAAFQLRARAASTLDCLSAMNNRAQC